MSKSDITRRNRVPEDDFYESMPMTAMPHSIYSDDIYNDFDTDRQSAEDAEATEVSHRLIGLIMLAVAVLALIAVTLLVAFGLMSASDSTAAPAATVAPSSLQY